MPIVRDIDQQFAARLLRCPSVEDIDELFWINRQIAIDKDLYVYVLQFHTRQFLVGVLSVNAT
jgi:hypothetical protein